MFLRKLHFTDETIGILCRAKFKCAQAAVDVVAVALWLFSILCWSDTVRQRSDFCEWFQISYIN